MNNKIKTAFFIIFLVVAGIGGYSYFYGKLDFFNFFKKSTNKIDNSINFSFNTKAEIKIKEKGKNEEKFNFEIKNASIMTKNSGLNERFQIEKLNIDINGKNKILISDIDTISDNEKIYYKGNFGKYSTLIFSEELNKVLKNGKYARINNSKSLLKTLGELQNNDLIKEMAIGIMTSNPGAYYEKNKTFDKLIKELKTDKLLNFVFKDGEYEETTKKTKLLLNNNLCKLNSIVGNLIPFPYYSSGKENCIKNLKKANTNLSIINLYKEGNPEKEDYKFVLNFGKVIDINLEYKKHNLDTWKILIEDPAGIIKIRANGNSDKAEKSLVKINYSNNGIIFTGEIKNGNGKITIKNTNNNNKFKLNGFVNIKNYGLESYELIGNSTNGNAKLISKANQEEGHLKLELQNGLSFNIDYKNKILTFNLKSNIFNGKGKINKTRTKITLIENLTTNIKFLANYGDINNSNYSLIINSDRNSGKINLDLGKRVFTYYAVKKDFIFGRISDYGTKLNVKLNFKKIEDLNLLIKVFYINKKIETEKHYFSIKGKKENDIYKYNLIGKYEGKKLMNGNTEFKIDGNKITSKGNLKVKNKDFTASIMDLQTAIEMYYQDTSKYPKKEDFIKGNNNKISVLDFYGSDFNIIITDKPGKNTFKYTVSNDNNGIEYGAFKLTDNNKTVGTKLGENKKTFYIKIESKNKKSEYKYSAEYNFEFDYKKGKAKYEIPKIFEEVKIKIFNIKIIPNFEQVFSKPNKKVITGIIGIAGVVGVGTTVIYNKQLEKARDSTRITDLNALRMGVEQVYQDTSDYPTKENFIKQVTQYLPRIPKDRKRGQIINGCEFGYKYEVGNDSNGLANGAYKLSTCLENSGNQKKATGDGFSDDKRLETGIKIGNIKESFYVNDLNFGNKKSRFGIQQNFSDI